ncbi:MULTISPECIES: site-specific integrase [unclassified Sphingomonas]|uniref:site-specific integrase n=1 Tax=unclassified Sphingomonas TaxID=196159 RepID=UPI0007013C28|nr:MULTISPECIES: tyrosine-type recombinase/integrase [unclassified Sphingomonas]KQS46283.1 integrase [Sphingomonas sp. Leaf198]TCP66002.1 site-specific recombinase XerD [Sphingomonas sp. PP-CE-1G-424]
MNDDLDDTALTRIASTPLIPLLLDDEIEAARAYVAAARAPATRRAYDSDWRIFQAWCAPRAITSLPAAPESVAIFLSAEAQAGVRPSTIGRRLAAIGYMHAQAGYDPPQQKPGAVAIRNAVAGIRRTHGIRKVQKRAADGDMLRDMLRGCDGDSVRAVRDRALLAIGMAAALRRSELVALEIDDVAITPEGLMITVRKSKTDQEGEGAIIAIPEGRRIRPKALLLAWIACAGFDTGPVFRKLTPQGRITTRPMSDRGVALVVKARAAAAGYDPAQVSGHSLRAGFLTEAARQGATVFKMKEVSRHKSLEILSDYVRNHELFRDHAGERFL